MIRNNYLFSVLFTALFFMVGFGQNNAHSPLMKKSPIIPKIVHYSRADFKADPQFWTMCENDDGTLIFGNNDGALIFDGAHWQKKYLPNNSSVRSILKTSEGKIFVGGYNEIGTLQKDKYGSYYYKSLMSEFHLEDKNLENLWQIHQYNKLIIYRSFLELIVINGNRVTQIPASKSFAYAAQINNNYFVQDADFGIYKLNTKTMSLELVFDAALFSNQEIASILPTTNPNSIAVVMKNGLMYFGDIISKSFSKQINLFEGSKSDQITYGIANGNNDYLFGTLSSKIIKFNSPGVISKEYQTLSDLSNASIHFIYQTQNKNLWVLQNNGLNLLDYKSSFISIFDQASVYDILIKNNRVYAATNNGVYYADFNATSNESLFNFNKIENLQGQTWAIQDLDGDVIISHDIGIFKLENNIVQKISSPNGFWKLTKIKNKKGLFLASNYNGLYLVEKSASGWSIKHKIKGFEESTRDIIADYEPNTYWICHGYKGVYKVHINDDYTRVNAVDHFTNKNGFKSPYNINAFYWNSKIIFTTNTGIYTFNNTNNKFEPFPELNIILGTKLNIRKVIQKKDKTWFVQDDEAGYFDNTTKKVYKNIFLNLKGTFNRGMESIYPLADDRVIFGTNSGLHLYRINANQTKTKLPTIISRITYSQNKKMVLAQIDAKGENIQLPNQTDLLRFEFAAPKMISSTELNYSYRLKNVDEDWSPWQKNAYKEYTHLRPGNYTFVVKSRDLSGLIGEEVSVEFRILPKWYQTNLAYFLYIIGAIFLLYSLVKYVKRIILLEQTKSKIEAKKTQQLLELEIEKLKLKQDKETIHKDKLMLEENIIDKSKELANYTLLLSQKKDIFSELQNDLKQLRELLKSDESRRKITEIFQKLNQHKIGEEYMEIFDVNFEKINHEFFEKLKQIDPSITKRELRLCAFIKMDLTNKEISPLLNISIRGVESARYKVRKKLNVAHEENFVSFLENLTKKQ
jgi:AraC family transcriptional regulator, chitin signaling transcriptional activator